MGASVGDRLVITGHHIGEPAGDTKILELHGLNGTPWLRGGSNSRHRGLSVPDTARTPSRHDSPRSG